MTTERTPRPRPLMTRRFLIVGLQRSGTTFAAATVGGHPQTQMLAPELRQDFFDLGVQRFVSGEATFDVVRDTYPRLFDAVTGGAADVVARGAKTAVAGHGEALSVCDCLQTFLTDVRVVLVTRRDLIASCGSLLRARRSGVWHSWSGGASERPIRIAPRALRRYVEDARAAVQRFRRLRDTHEVLELSYEDDVCGGKAHERLFDFLGLESVDPTWVHLKKLNPDPRSYIKNHSRLVRALAALPEAGADEEARRAEARRGEASRTLPAPFLLGRAAFLAGQGRPSDAIADLRRALAHADAAQRPFPLAQAYAALEAAAGDADRPALDALLRDVDAACGHNPAFLTARGTQRAGRGIYDLAERDLVAALLDERDPLGDNAAASCLNTLRGVLQSLGEAPRQRDAIAALAPRYRTHPQFIKLQRALSP